MARRHGKLRARAESRCRKRALALTCAGSPPAALRFVASMYGAGAASVERSRRARAAVSVTARYRALPSISYRVRATSSTAWRLRITGIPTRFVAGMPEWCRRIVGLAGRAWIANIRLPLCEITHDQVARPPLCLGAAYGGGGSKEPNQRADSRPRNRT